MEQKKNGKLRPLGIPCICDRVVQRAVLLIIEPIFEADFLDCSHGFRPDRSAHNAMKQIRSNINDGRGQVYDADLSSYSGGRLSVSRILEICMYGSMREAGSPRLYSTGLCFNRPIVMWEGKFAWRLFLSPSLVKDFIEWKKKWLTEKFIA